MRLGLRAAAIAMAVLALPVALLGAKVAACVNDTVFASQKIGTGTMTLAVWSTAPGAVTNAATHTVTCPTVTIMRSTDASGAACQLHVQSTGSIAGSEIKVTATLSFSRFALARFTLTPNAGTYGKPAFTLDALGTSGSGRLIADIKGSKLVARDNALDPTVTWSSLTDDDLGGSLTMTYTFVLSE